MLLQQPQISSQLVNQLLVMFPGNKFLKDIVNSKNYPFT